VSSLGRNSAVGIIGAGAMGTGIAQVAATAGHRVILFDANADTANRAIESIGAVLDRQVAKNKMSADDARAITERLSVANTAAAEGDYSVLAQCDIVIEAIVEDLKIKQHLFADVEAAVHDDCVLATNTSSLSVTAIARGCRNAQRVIGIHFFNPAPVLPLVEIVPGIATSETVTRDVRALVDSWGKTTVLASDTPGFIVNRVARPFYGEAIRIYEERIADPATIDWAMRELGGFRMGPFELMDFIGHDVNFATTSSVYEGTFFDPRYKPSVTQQRLVQAGLLGRKTGRGFYDYSEGATRPEPIKDNALGQQILTRIRAMLINEAADAVAFGIGSVDDVDLAMTKGVNYPRGLLAWADEIGIKEVLDTLEQLQSDYAEDRYRPSLLLKRMSREGKKFHQ
jgi:3-hydroxybutyryl-CoA dehydrogenase